MSDFFRAFCQCFLCFHTHSGFERNNFIFLFSSIPCRTFPKAVIRHHIRRKQESADLCRFTDWRSSGAISAARFSADRTLNWQAAISGDGAWHLISDTSINSLSFHQHRGEKALTRVFSSTSWRGENPTFFLHLFSLTYRLSASLFNPPFFPWPWPTKIS